jgi:AraC family transcriptional regulator
VGATCKTSLPLLSLFSSKEIVLNEGLVAGSRIDGSVAIANNSKPFHQPSAKNMHSYSFAKRMPPLAQPLREIWQQGELQKNTLTAARGYQHFGSSEAPPLSLKTMFNGCAHYTVGRRAIAVDETNYLLLNEGQAYSIDIDSNTQVESFVIWFPDGWAEDVQRTLRNSATSLLDSPGGSRSSSQACHFFDRTTRHDKLVSPEVFALRRAHKRGALPDNLLAEKLRFLLETLLRSQDNRDPAASVLSSLRPSTRHELRLRISRARDIIHSRLSQRLRIDDIAAEACLSPYHFIRVFKLCYGETPHAYLTRCRLDRARFLLERTNQSVTDICFSVGFESLGSFSSLFKRATGLSPSALRQYGRDPSQIRNFEEASISTGR